MQTNTKNTQDTITRKIKTTKQKIASIEMQLARDKIKKRKAVLRKKIVLGAFIVDVGMNQYTHDIILGALLTAKENIEQNDQYKQLYKTKAREWLDQQLKNSNKKD